MSTWERSTVENAEVVGRSYEGELDATGLRFGIVVSRFNHTITHMLLEGTQIALLAHGAEKQSIDVAWVPGAFELPLIAKKMAQSGSYDAVVCLGAVIRGETVHFEYVAGEAANGVAAAALETGIPILFGVLTTETLEQAVERADTSAGNKGAETAMAAIEVANLIAALES